MKLETNENLKMITILDNQEIFRRRRSVQEESSDVLNKNQEKNRENFKNFCREENNKLF